MIDPKRVMTSTQLEESLLTKGFVYSATEWLIMMTQHGSRNK